MPNRRWIAFRQIIPLNSHTVFIILRHVLRRRSVDPLFRVAKADIPFIFHLRKRKEKHTVRPGNSTPNKHLPLPCLQHDILIHQTLEIEFDLRGTDAELFAAIADDAGPVGTGFAQAQRLDGFQYVSTVFRWHVAHFGYFSGKRRNISSEMTTGQSKSVAGEKGTSQKELMDGKEKQQKEKNVLEITALGPAHAEMDGRRAVFWPMTIVAFNTQRIERSIYEQAPPLQWKCPLDGATSKPIPRDRSF